MTDRRAQLGTALVWTAVVLVTDQAAKWLAWRHLGTAVVNEGGVIVLSPDTRDWFARPTEGAVVTVVGLVLVAAGFGCLLYRPRSPGVLAGGTLVAAGWLSNLLDRLGLHEWSAPGSPRGVVDFIPSGGTSRFNVADVWIVLGVLLLAYAAVRARARRPSHDR